VTTINTRLAEARHRLCAAGIPTDEAALDARLLAQFLLGWDSARILTSGNDAESEGFANRYEAAISRRATREPLAYITGVREFWNRPFEVSAAVLIPRPETEGLVEELLDRFPDTDTPMTLVDACTGSGCVAVSIACERRNARIVATDLSRPALTIARRNAARHGVGDRVRCVRADLVAGLAGPFDAIVANPPYVPVGVRRALQPEVRDFEPEIALFAGPDGLEITARLLQQSLPILKRGGHLIFEFGDGREMAVRELVAAAGGLLLAGVRSDLRGIPRVAVALRE
jgi:release factor glutamine methyltransferase